MCHNSAAYLVFTINGESHQAMNTDSSTYGAIISGDTTFTSARLAAELANHHLETSLLATD